MNCILGAAGGGTLTLLLYKLRSIYKIVHVFAFLSEKAYVYVELKLLIPQEFHHQDGGDHILSKDKNNLSAYRTLFLIIFHLHFPLNFTLNFTLNFPVYVLIQLTKFIKLSFSLCSVESKVANLGQDSITQKNNKFRYSV